MKKTVFALALFAMLAPATGAFAFGGRSAPTGVPTCTANDAVFGAGSQAYTRSASTMADACAAALNACRTQSYFAWACRVD